ncbi:MFS transporter [Rhizobium lusitanum]|uniref:MFS transporter n=1 Tax=Rhizobium lusitanum TaxID=293958 RepID=UPI00195D9536|nr:MFS transporter [Rhizobium lusitanum]MBM7049208.1 MFS transporter [Rhizobium lusitanum]
MSANAISTKLDGRYWKLAIAGGMASYLDSAAIISVGISLAIWQKAFGMDPWAVGFLSASLTFSIAIGALVGGRIADVLGRRPVFNTDLALYVIGVATILMASSQNMLIAGVIITGLAAGADLPTSIAVISERAPKGGQGRMVAFTQVMWTIGIVVATLIGFMVAHLGMLGVKILFLHLIVVAVPTLLIRIFSRSFREMEEEAKDRNSADDTDIAVPLKTILTTRKYLNGIVMTAAFYIFYGLVANTFGQFKTYFLVTVGDASQATATGFSFCATLVGLACASLFTRAADTKWRNRLFYFGAILLVLGLSVAALSGGKILWIMLIVLIMYNLSNPFAGEAIYKVWTQEIFPVNARATAQGITYAIARFVFAGFALVTPAIIAWSPSGLFWMLVGLAIVSAVIGSLLIRANAGITASLTPMGKQQPA